MRTALRGIKKLGPNLEWKGSYSQMLLIDLSLADTADTIDQPLTDRAKREVRLIYVFCFLDPGQVVAINNVEENRAGRYVELVDWKWPTSIENYNAIAMYFNSFHILSVICVEKWMAQWRRKKCWQALILFVPGVQFWKRKFYSIRKRSVGLEDQRVN